MDIRKRFRVTKSVELNIQRRKGGHMSEGENEWEMVYRRREKVSVCGVSRVS